MRKTLIEVEKRRKAKTDKWQGLVFGVLVIGAVVVLIAFAPWGQSIATILLAVLVGGIGAIIGYGKGQNERRFLNLRSAGGFVSVARQRQETILSIDDMTGSPTAYRADDFAQMIDEVFKTFPYKQKSQIISEDLSEVKLNTSWPGTWVFLTCDSADRPVYLSFMGIVTALADVKEYIPDENLRRRIRASVSRLSDQLASTIGY